MSNTGKYLLFGCGVLFIVCIVGGPTVVAWFMKKRAALIAKYNREK